MLHIALSGEEIFTVLGFSVTNSLLTTWIVMMLLAIGAYFTSSRITLIPGWYQNFVEVIIGGLFDLFEGVLGNRTQKFYPLLATLFIFIIASNWIGLLPGIESIGIKNSLLDKPSQEHVESVDVRDSEVVVKKTDKQGMVSEEIELIQDKKNALSNENSTKRKIKPESEESVAEEVAMTPLFRSPTADLNTTIALALISFAILQAAGIKALGTFTYIGKFINFKSPIDFFVGILEIISEIGKIISFAFRLFGNIFAGDVLLAVIAFLIPLFAPIPFLGLEIFVGFIQALVFAMLTAVFIAAAISHEAH